jgi:hypothetical protein
MYKNQGRAGQHLHTQLEMLAGIWWPLVITTNYESLFVDAWNQCHADAKPLPEFNRMEVVGRGRADCQRVLNSTRAPDNPLLWALQGYVGEGAEPALTEQLAIGHEEYRRQVHESVHFRRAFAEIYRSRVLLFVGSGLSESYLLDLFGEALELMGAIDHFHFALIEAGTADPEFLLRRFQIRVIEYELQDSRNHGPQVAGFLKGLSAAIDAPRVRNTAWSLKLDSRKRLGLDDPEFHFKVARASLFDRTINEAGTAVAISAGINRKSSKARLLLGEKSMGWLEKKGLSRDNAVPSGKYVSRIPDSNVYLVAARDLQKSGSDARDSRHVAPAIRELLECATKDGYSRIYGMLLAGGAKRTFPQHIGLRQMIKGYREWYDVLGGVRPIPLTVHLVDPVVLSYLESGRLDLATVASSGSIHFWVQISRGGKADAPVLDFARPDCKISEIAACHAITDQSWRVSIRPAPVGGHTARTIGEIESEALSIADLGVTDGATVMFSNESFGKAVRLSRPIKERCASGAE